MKHDIHHLRRFCSRTIDPLEKGTLASLKYEYEDLKQYLDNLEREIAVSKARKYKFSWEGDSPYAILILGSHTISYKLAKVAVGILSYDYLEMVEKVIEFMPPLEDYHSHSRDAKLIGGFLGMFLPISLKLRNNFYNRSHLDELQAWYDKHKDNLIWDEENFKFYLDDLDEKAEDDRSSSE